MGMSVLTEEYLDKKLTEQTRELKGYVDGRLEVQSQELKQHVSEEISELARMVQEGFEEVQRKLDVREEVELLRKQMTEVRHAIGLN